MAATSSNIVFDDLFTINAIDKDGKKFDRVSRLFAHSSNYDMDLTLDYNTELYPLKSGESFSLVLASSLVRAVEGGAINGTDGTEEEKDTHIWRPDGKGRRGLEEDYEYVMYGRVYKFDGGTAEIVTAYLSFGGLLMSLTGSYRHMTGIVLGEPVYLLMRR
ncbi:RNA polymerase I [Fomitiporia mediterranea MF3/22]|uniref:RNA polymerase I n=1 Tax=Fomitiporia mediterranea (strain MF3/22) TaxID=694068 RepID=UPI0004407E83|nr:RNA polymerase I [Fomitiporia mediterranea MF3/22]EJD03977.1 RNA polymerase I [Fomitiporia mediterranea MF3/22]